MIIVAGEGVTNLSDVIMLNLDTMVWISPQIEFKNGAFTARKFHTATAIDPQIY
jgi:hypothetical protein